MNALTPAAPTHTRLIFWLLVGLHCASALVLKFAVGLDIEAHVQVGSWDWYWQAVPTANLIEHPLRSIWFFHAQPPVFNLLGALLIRLFYPYHLQALQYVYIAMGALVVGMTYVITLSMTRSVKLSLFVALFWALNPALFLYESYILYDMLTAFLVTTLIFGVACHHLAATKPTGYLVGSLVMLTLLVLTRSLYHLVLFVPGVLLTCVLAGRQWRRLLVVGLCCALLPLGWYAKNAQQVGQFGGSTWLGIGLWKIAIADYTPEELLALAAQGVIDPVVAEVNAYSRPASYIPYGFAAVSTNDEWKRDDFNNVNIPAISKTYQTNSLRLIRHDPVRYLKAVFSGFYLFADPASRFYHLDTRRAQLGPYEWFYAEILQGHYPFARLGISGSILVILLPYTLLLYGVGLVGRAGVSPTRWAALIRGDAPMICAALIIAYTLVVGCTLEFSENMRFKFVVEGPMWAFMAAVLYRRYRRPPLVPLPTASKSSA